MERVGIRSRRTVMPLDYIRETRNRETREAAEAAELSNAQLGARAAEMALARAGISASEVGLVIGGSCAPDTVSPAEACNLARELEIEAPALDVNSACTSYLAGMRILDMMRPEALPDYTLVVCMESMTRTVDYSDRSAAVLWGDGALAAVVSPRAPGRAQIIGTSLDSSPAGNEKVVIPREGFFEQEGRTVQMFAIKKTIRVLRRLQKEFTDPDRRLHFVGHQANLRMLESVCDNCGIPRDRHHSTVVDFGNTGAAGAPGVLSMHWDLWQPGDDVALVGVGAGLTWSGYIVRFGESP